MAAPAPHQLRSELLRLAHRGLGVGDFSLAAARLIAPTVPFDGVCVLAMDPATLLPTHEMVESGLPPAATARMIEIELGGRDVNSFGALAASRRHAATLSHATGGDLDRSARHRELRGPHGFGDELRAVLVDKRTAWGALTLLRAAGERDFTPADAARIASLSSCLAEGLRRAVLLGAAPAQPEQEQAAVVVLAADNTIMFADEAAQGWLSELGSTGVEDRLPAPLHAVARRARSSADPATAEPHLARARVRGASGRWLLVRGSMLAARPDAPTVLIIEPARGYDMAPLIAAGYGLSDRERTITQLAACGYGTEAIADRLHLSAWTVQDHFKSIFDKVAVTTRGELIARLFFEHQAPRLSDQWRAEPGR